MGMSVGWWDDYWWDVPKCPILPQDAPERRRDVG